MKQIEDLQKRWHESVRFRGLHATMSLEKDALVLGAGTVLARRDRDGALVLDGEDAKLLTLLSVACGQPVRASVLGIVRKASRHARAGDDAMAAMYLALAKLPKLHDPSDSARRLFIADALMAEGVSPRDIWTALDFDPAPLDELDKRYNPDQPRVPAGSGKTSGEWTSGDAPGASSARVVPQDAVDAAERAAAAEGDAAAETLAERTWWASVLALGPRAAGPLVFMSALLYSTPAGGERRFGRVPGHPDLTWDEEEGLFTVARESDGEVVLQAKRGPDGKLRVIKYRGLERLQNEHSQIDPDLLPADDPRATHRDEPGFCPEPPKPDPGGTAYATFMKAIVNEPPTPDGFGYWLSNPYSNGDIVKYDDCERKTGTMIEYKGTGYADMLGDKGSLFQLKDSITREWLDEATRQIEASQGRPVRWYFAELGALNYARQLFSARNILKRIELVYAPPPWRSK